MANQVRYFTRTDSEGKPILSCFRRLRIGTTAMGEDRWTGDDWEEDFDAPLVRMLTLGQGDYDEVTPDLARETWPEAFA